MISATFSLVFSGFWARLGSCFVDFSGFSYLFWRFFRLFRWFWGAVLWISAVPATFFRNFSGCFAGVGELFCGFQRFQLLFSGIFPAFGLDLRRGHWNKTKKRFQWNHYLSKWFHCCFCIYNIIYNPYSISIKVNPAVYDLNAIRP